MRILAVAVAILGPGVGVPQAHADADQCSLEPTGGLATATLPETEVAGLLVPRSYELYVPDSLQDNLPAGTRVPLLLTFHGTGSSGASHADQTDWTGFAKDQHLIVAFPNARARAFNLSQGSADVEYARAVVDHIGSRYCVNPARVHASGHSNGGYFSHRLACDAHDVVASVTPYASGSATGGCGPTRPVSVGLFHGEDDRVVTVSQGASARDGWVERNGCDPEPADESPDDGEQLRYVCEEGVEVLWRTYIGQGHLWPPEPRSREMKALMWTFLRRHPNPAYPPLEILDGPANPSHSTSAAFALPADGDFECRLDDTPFQPCTSPVKYGKLGVGAHVFQAREVGGRLNADPATWRWTIAYGFDGFATPVLNPPSINRTSSGRTHPLKWTLLLDDRSFDDRDAVAGLGATAVSCQTPTSHDERPDGGLDDIRYDAEKEQFVARWIAPAEPGCYDVAVALDDGTAYTARFEVR